MHLNSMKNQSINERKKNVKAQKILIIYLLIFAEIVLQFQINKISQTHHSKNKNIVIITNIIFIEDVFIYFLFLHMTSKNVKSSF